MGEFEAKALNEATRLVNELESVSGRTFTVGTISSSSKTIDIFEVKGKNNYHRSLCFTGSTWKDTYCNVYAALKTLHVYISLADDAKCAKAG